MRYFHQNDQKPFLEENTENFSIALTEMLISPCSATLLRPPKTVCIKI